MQQEKIPLDDFEDAAYILEETERIKKEQADIKRQRRRQELERLHRLALEEQERILAEAEAEREKVRLAKINEENLLKILEEQRLEKERAEQLQKDRETILIFLKDINSFGKSVANQLLKRQEQQQMQQKLLNQINEEKRKRMDAKAIANKDYRRIGR